MTIQIDKFSPLSQGQIEDIISRLNDEERESLAGISQKAFDYLSRDSDFKALNTIFKNELADNADNRELAAKTINNNILIIARFLNKLGLIGSENEAYEESFEVTQSNLIPGAHARVLLNAYYAHKSAVHKDQSKRLRHVIAVIPNALLFDSEYQKSPSLDSVFFTSRGIHRALKDRLKADFSAVGINDDLNKTYIVQIIGSTGGDHWVSLTVRKRCKDNRPVVELFDPSIKLMRDGVGFQDGLANGLSVAQISINATLVSVFEEFDLELAQENFFHNLEYLQQDAGNCSTFAHEHAKIAARMTFREHEEVLRKRYVHPSLFGGMSEINWRADLGHNLPLQYVYMSQFYNSALESHYQEGLQQQDRIKKDGSKESVWRRVERYTELRPAKRTQDSAGINKLQGDGDMASSTQLKKINALIAQKSLRQKYGHLAEIITSDAFLNLHRACHAHTDQPLSSSRSYSAGLSKDTTIGNMYNVDGSEELNNGSEELNNFISVIKNDILKHPGIKNNVTIKKLEIGSGNRNDNDKEEQKYEVSFRLGSDSAKKLEEWSQLPLLHGLVLVDIKENSLYDLQFKLSENIDWEFCKVCEVKIILSPTREISESIRGFFKNGNHPLSQRQQPSIPSL